MLGEEEAAKGREGDGFEDVVKYWASAWVKNNGKFALSYLDEQVLSWSLREDLLRNKVSISLLPCTVAPSFFCTSRLWSSAAETRIYAWTMSSHFDFRQILLAAYLYSQLSCFNIYRLLWNSLLNVATSNRLLKRTKTDQYSIHGVSSGSFDPNPPNQNSKA